MIETTMSVRAIGWITELVGLALWFYGYFFLGHPSIINWHDHSPWWIAEWLPNLEAEIGALIMLVALIPMYWPQRP